MDDPRFEKYRRELIAQGISEETARRAAIVRIESEDKRARIYANLDSYRKGRR